MALTGDEIDEIDALLRDAEASSGAIADLRRRFPRLSLTRCDASDVDAERPFRTYHRFHLYLVDGAAHCWQLTPDPERATGLVVADHKGRP